MSLPKKYTQSRYCTQNSLLMTKLLKFYNINNEDGTYNPNNNLDKLLKIIASNDEEEKQKPTKSKKQKNKNNENVNEDEIEDEDQSIPTEEIINTSSSSSSGSKRMSLRIIDWFSTNYAKKFYTIYEIRKPGEDMPVRFKVYDDYKLELKAYSKKRFDPFCRYGHIKIPYVDGQLAETTIGQLNFFMWALENKVIDYIESHYDLIEKDMNKRNSTSRRKETITDNSRTRKKREELSLSATKSIKKEIVEIVVKFH
jgi:hypothetical protein